MRACGQPLDSSSARPSCTSLERLAQWPGCCFFCCRDGEVVDQVVNDKRGPAIGKRLQLRPTSANLQTYLRMVVDVNKGTASLFIGQGATEPTPHAKTVSGLRRPLRAFAYSYSKETAVKVQIVLNATTSAGLSEDEETASKERSERVISRWKQFITKSKRKTLDKEYDAYQASLHPVLDS